MIIFPCKELLVYNEINNLACELVSDKSVFRDKVDTLQNSHIHMWYRMCIVRKSILLPRSKAWHATTGC